jgi:hypothetical protein
VDYLKCVFSAFYRGGEHEKLFSLDTTWCPRAAPAGNRFSQRECPRARPRCPVPSAINLRACSSGQRESPDVGSGEECVLVSTKHGNQGIAVSSLPFIVLLRLPATASPPLICRDCLEPNPEAASRRWASAAWCWGRIVGVTPSKDRRAGLETTEGWAQDKCRDG